MRSMLFIFFTAMLILSGCNGCKVDLVLENDFNICFTLIDKISDQNLLEVSSFYNKDSVKVYNSNQEVVFPGPVSGNGQVCFAPYWFENHEIPVGKDTSEFYYLHLIKNGIDIDTLEVNYKTSYDKCDDKRFTYLNFYYNEELVYSSDKGNSSFFVELFK